MKHWDNPLIDLAHNINWGEIFDFKLLLASALTWYLSINSFTSFIHWVIIFLSGITIVSKAIREGIYWYQVWVKWKSDKKGGL